MEEKISIIIPIYNAEKFLDRCIKSVITQSYTNLEIILINDGSKDGSYEICKKYEKKDKRIKLFQQENAGVSVARNLGLKKMTGKYLMFLDADDYYEKDICKVLIKNIKEHNADIGIVNKKFLINGIEVLNCLYNDDNFVRTNEEKELFILDLFTFFYDKKMNKVKYLSCGVTAKIFNAELINKNKIRFLENCHFGEDVLFNLYAFQFAKRISYRNYNGYNFVVSENSSTHKYREFWEDSHNKFVDEIDAFVEKFDKDNRYYEVAKMMRVTRITGLMAIYYFHKDNKKRFITKYKEFKSLINKEEYKKSLKEVDVRLLTRNQKMIVYILKLKLGLLFAFIYNKK